MKSTGELTKQERKVVNLLLEGKSNKQIAAVLGITMRTAEFHLNHIYKKLGVASRTEAVLKLAKESPRESTGLARKGGNQGKTTVAKTGEMTNNGGNPFRQWARKMPTVTYALIVASLLLVALGIMQLIPGSPMRPASGGSVRASAVLAIATQTATPSPTPTATSTPRPTVSSPATPVTGSSTARADPCKGAMSSKPAGPKANVALVNATKGSATFSLNLAKNKFGDCGYSSYVVTRGGSIYLRDVLPFGCYGIYALINDPKNPTQVTTGPVCISDAAPMTLRLSYTKISILPGP